MPDDLNNDPQRQELLDEEFRKVMREQTHPQAEKWVQLDDRAISLEEQVLDKERDIDGRREGVLPAHLALQEARLDREEHRGSSSDNYEGGRKKWDQDYKDLDEEVAQRDKAFGEALKNASPEDLAKLQENIDQKREAMMKTIEERQGIAKLPSERAQDGQQSQSGDWQQEWASQVELSEQSDDRQERGVQEAREQVPSQDQQPAQERDQDQHQAPELDPYVIPQGQMGDRLRMRREQPEDEQSEGQGQGGAVAGRRLQPNFAAYATTQAELDADRQLHEDQLTLTRQLGHRPTHDQVVKFERERAESVAAGAENQGQGSEQQASGEGAGGSQQDQGSDLHAQALRATADPMADRVAARRAQGATGQQGQGSEQGRGESAEHKDEAGQSNTAELEGKKEAEASRGASTVAERQAKQAEQVERKSEAKAEQTQTKSQARNEEDGNGMGM